MGIVFESDGTVLREFGEDDWPALAEEGERASPDEERSARDTARHFAQDRHAEPRKQYALAVVPRSRGRAVGWCVLRIIDAGFGEAEIGWAVAGAYRGRGYATAGSRAMLAYGFGELGLHRIFATCHADIAASEAVMRKLGMRREGLMREKEREGDIWHHHLLYAILERDRAERLNG